MVQKKIQGGPEFVKIFNRIGKGNYDLRAQALTQFRFAIGARLSKRASTEREWETDEHG